MSSVFQKSFMSGEITPAIYARCDLLKYSTGLRTLRNMYVGRHGGAYNRGGTIYRSQAHDSTHRIRLIPFVLPGNFFFQLEFGHLYVRILQDGVPIQTSVKDIQSISQAASAVVTVKEFHSMIVGDQVTFSGVSGMTGINGLTGTITAVANNLTFTVNINSSGFGAYTGSGQVTPVTPHDIWYPTIYTESVLREFTYVQQDQTLVVAHQSGFPLQMTYNSPESWTLVQDASLVVPSIPATSIISGPTNTFILTCSPAANATSGAVYTGLGCTFTVVNTISGGSTLTVTANTRPSPVAGTITKTSGTGDATITVTNSQDSGGLATYWGVTAIKQDSFEESLIAIWGSSATTGPITISWLPVQGAVQYNVYRGNYPNTLGFLEISNNAFYVDDFSLKPDFTSPPPIERVIFANVGSAGPGSMLPAAVGYFQQRRFWGNLGPPNTALGIPPVVPLYPNYPDRIFGSRIGSTTYFNQQRPTPDDGEVSFRMLYKIPQEIRHFLDIGKLAVFTSQGEWVLEGDPNTGGITPSGINPTSISQNGSGFTAPVAIGSTALYVNYNPNVNTTTIRTLGFQFEIDGYKGDDITIFSSHLVDNHQILAFTYQRLPHPIVWSCREDGIMLGCTYVPEQNLLAWHRHDFTNGFVEDLTTSGDMVYLAIKRVINGQTVRYIERLKTRQFVNIADAVFLDAAKTIDGRNANPSATITMSGGTNWTYDETLTATASLAQFVNAQVGTFIHFTGASGELIRFKITGFTSSTVVTGQPDKTVPAEMRNVALNSWANAYVTVTGLSHLEGQQVSILGDGFVISSPNNPEYPTLTVTGGSVTLSDGSVGYSVVQVGLPITADLETLDIDNPQGPTMMDKQKLITRVALWLNRSRGGFVGGSAPDDDADNPVQGLELRLDELKYRYEEGYDQPNALLTKAVTVNIEGRWNSNGRIFIRQVDPLPFGILAVAPEGFIPIGVP